MDDYHYQCTTHHGIYIFLGGIHIIEHIRRIGSYYWFSKENQLNIPHPRWLFKRLRGHKKGHQCPNFLGLHFQVNNNQTMTCFI
jgi:hypothetical protein